MKLLTITIIVCSIGLSPLHGDEITLDANSLEWGQTYVNYEEDGYIFDGSIDIGSYPYSYYPKQISLSSHSVSLRHTDNHLFDLISFDIFGSYEWLKEDTGAPGEGFDDIYQESFAGLQLNLNNTTALTLSPLDAVQVDYQQGLGGPSHDWYSHGAGRYRFDIGALGKGLSSLAFLLDDAAATVVSTNASGGTTAHHYGAGQYGVYVDNIVLRAPQVPEPSEYALMIIGLAGLFLYRIRRKEA